MLSNYEDKSKKFIELFNTNFQASTIEDLLWTLATTELITRIHLNSDYGVKEKILIEILKSKQTVKKLIVSIPCTLRLSLIHICRCRRYAVCRSRWSPYH
eukprot:TRINITY_DN26661_c0_g2_i1.p1 TRINITY_DN26661_c0_g2~~TRINITY_DN26661_c0_g2_i1.p1  ORF type:complete len:100 (-),score=11.20 TRINITY_DN26661_c0_g2_i1:9-308(-)